MKPIDTTQPTEPAKTTAVDDARNGDIVITVWASELVALRSKVSELEAQLQRMTEDRDAWEETARQFEATYKSEVVDVQNQLRQERDTVAEQKYLMGLASEHRDKLEEQVAQLNTKLGDQGTAIHAYILELSKAEAQIVQLQTTVGQLRETIERAFNAKIHPFQTDEGRDYCQCGYYKVHPIHALAALATCPAPEAVGQPPL